MYSVLHFLSVCMLLKYLDQNIQRKLYNFISSRSLYSDIVKVSYVKEL